MADAIELSWRRVAAPLFKLASIRFEQGNLDDAVAHGLASLELAADHIPSMLLVAEIYAS